MSQQGPIIVVSNAARPSFATALDDAKLFPVVEIVWAEASRAVERLQPAAVLAALADGAAPGFEALAREIAARLRYLPLIAIHPRIRLPENAIPVSQSCGNVRRLMPRLCATLRA